MEDKRIALNITGGTITEESATIATDRVLEILGACLDHRDSEVTVAALAAITKMVRPSADHMTITDCSFNISESKSQPQDDINTELEE
jgi:hypothetical protein